MAQTVYQDGATICKCGLLRLAHTTERQCIGCTTKRSTPRRRAPSGLRNDWSGVETEMAKHLFPGVVTLGKGRIGYQPDCEDRIREIGRVRVNEFYNNLDTSATHMHIELPRDISLHRTFVAVEDGATICLTPGAVLNKCKPEYTSTFVRYTVPLSTLLANAVLEWSHEKPPSTSSVRMQTSTSNITTLTKDSSTQLAWLPEPPPLRPDLVNPPMCNCTLHCVRCMAIRPQNPANTGRWYYVCPRITDDCGFFSWASVDHIDAPDRVSEMQASPGLSIKVKLLCELHGYAISPASPYHVCVTRRDADIRGGDLPPGSALVCATATDTWEQISFKIPPSVFNDDIEYVLLETFDRVFLVATESLIPDFGRSRGLLRDRKVVRRASNLRRTITHKEIVNISKSVSKVQTVLSICTEAATPMPGSSFVPRLRRRAVNADEWGANELI